MKTEQHKKMKAQFNPDHEPKSHPKAKEWKTKTYPDYKDKTVTFNVQPPNHTEFGKAFALATLMVNDPLAAKAMYDMALTDFFKEKAINFPDWNGLPEIKIGPSTDFLQRDVTVAWYARVPREFVLNSEDKLEEDLWNS